MPHQDKDLVRDQFDLGAFHATVATIALDAEPGQIFLAALSGMMADPQCRQIQHCVDGAVGATLLFMTRFKEAQAFLNQHVEESGQ